MIKRLLILALVFGTTHITFVLSTALFLTQPQRRQIQPYHTKWLTQPKNYGMHIKQLNCIEAQVPCLLVSPNQQHLGRRGDIIQNQLLSKGISKKQLQHRNGIVVLLHGRQGRKEDLLPVAERFVAAGFYCVLPDLPAHGNSPIKTLRFATSEFEKNIANNVLKDAKKALNQPDLKAYLWGVSMGGAFANAAAANRPNLWQAIIIVSSFDTLENTLKNQIDFLPTGLQNMYLSSLKFALKIRYDFVLEDSKPINWVKTTTQPVLMVHGESDRVIRLAQGKRLFKNYPSTQKKWLTVSKATHHDVLTTDMPVYFEMVAWFLTH